MRLLFCCCPFKLHSHAPHYHVYTRKYSKFLSFSHTLSLSFIRALCGARSPPPSSDFYWCVCHPTTESTDVWVRGVPHEGPICRDCCVARNGESLLPDTVAPSSFPYDTTQSLSHISILTGVYLSGRPILDLLLCLPPTYCRCRCVLSIECTYKKPAHAWDLPAALTSFLSLSFSWPLSNLLISPISLSQSWFSSLCLSLSLSLLLFFSLCCFLSLFAAFSLSLCCFLSLSLCCFLFLSLLLSLSLSSLLSLSLSLPLFLLCRVVLPVSLASMTTILRPPP